MPRRPVIAMMLAVIAVPAVAQEVIDGAFPAAAVTFEQVHAALAPGMAEPGSAQYRDLVVTGGDGFTSICGWVTAAPDTFVRFAYQVEGRQGWLLPAFDDAAAGEAERALAATNGCPAQAYL